MSDDRGKSIAPRPTRVPTVARRPHQPPPVASPPLPNATIIYGAGGAMICVAGLSLLFHGRWFPAFVVLVIGACLLAFAWHLMGGRLTRRR